MFKMDVIMHQARSHMAKIPHTVSHKQGLDSHSDVKRGFLLAFE